MEPIFTIPPDLTIGESGEFLALNANWGVQTFLVDALRRHTLGEGVRVGIIDTGVDSSHPLLKNVIARRDFTGSSSGPADRNGHGTHVTGTVGATDERIGMAPGCEMVHGKGLSDGGSGGGAGIAAAIRWCANDMNCDIISMSLGSSGEDSRITAAMQEVSEQKNVWCIAAAGNSGGGTVDVDWPARSPFAIATAALGNDRNPASFTNRGNKIDTAFAGVGIWSTRTGGGFQQMSGTSMATPGAAGVLTLYRAGLKKYGRPIPTVVAMREKLKSRSVDVWTPGVDNRTGPGFISPVMLELDFAPVLPPVS